MYKLREDQLKDFYNTQEMEKQVQKSTSVKKSGAIHTDSLIDHSFLSMKSKEVRDSESPIKDVIYGTTVTTTDHGWNIITKDRHSMDGYLQTMNTIASTSGSEDIDKGHSEYAVKCDQETRIYSAGDVRPLVTSSRQITCTDDEHKKIKTSANKVSSSSSVGMEQRRSFGLIDDRALSASSEDTSARQLYTIDSNGLNLVPVNEKVTRTSETLPGGGTITTIQSETVCSGNIMGSHTEKYISTVNSSTTEKSHMNKATICDNETPHDVTVTKRVEVEESANDSGLNIRDGILNTITGNELSETKNCNISNRQTIKSAVSTCVNEKINTRADCKQIVDTAFSYATNEDINDLRDITINQNSEEVTKMIQISKDAMKKINDKSQTIDENKNEVMLTTRGDDLKGDYERRRVNQEKLVSHHITHVEEPNTITSKIIVVDNSPDNTKYIDIEQKQECGNAQASGMVSTKTSQSMLEKNIGEQKQLHSKQQDEYRFSHTKLNDTVTQTNRQPSCEIQTHYESTKDFKTPEKSSVILDIVATTVNSSGEPQQQSVKNPMKAVCNQPESEEQLGTGVSEFDEKKKPIRDQYSTTYRDDYTNKRISVEVSPTHQAFANSLRSISPDRFGKCSEQDRSTNKSIKTSTTSVRSSISPEKQHTSRNPDKYVSPRISPDKYFYDRSPSPRKVSETYTRDHPSINSDKYVSPRISPDKYVHDRSPSPRRGNATYTRDHPSRNSDKYVSPRASPDKYVHDRSPSPRSGNATYTRDHPSRNSDKYVSPRASPDKYVHDRSPSPRSGNATYTRDHPSRNSDKYVSPRASPDKYVHDRSPSPRRGNATYTRDDSIVRKKSHLHNESDHTASITTKVDIATVKTTGAISNKNQIGNNAFAISKATYPGNSSLKNTICEKDSIENCSDKKATTVRKLERDSLNRDITTKTDHSIVSPIDDVPKKSPPPEQRGTSLKTSKDKQSKRTDTYEERCRQILGLKDTNETKRISTKKLIKKDSPLRDTGRNKLSKSPEHCNTKSFKSDNHKTPEDKDISPKIRSPDKQTSDQIIGKSPDKNQLDQTYRSNKIHELHTTNDKQHRIHQQPPRQSSDRTYSPTENLPKRRSPDKMHCERNSPVNIQRQADTAEFNDINTERDQLLSERYPVPKTHREIINIAQDKSSGKIANVTNTTLLSDMRCSIAIPCNNEIRKDRDMQQHLSEIRISNEMKKRENSPDIVTASPLFKQDVKQPTESVQLKNVTESLNFLSEKDTSVLSDEAVRKSFNDQRPGPSKNYLEQCCKPRSFTNEFPTQIREVSGSEPKKPSSDFEKSIESRMSRDLVTEKLKNHPEGISCENIRVSISEFSLPIRKSPQRESSLMPAIPSQHTTITYEKKLNTHSDETKSYKSNLPPKSCDKKTLAERLEKEEPNNETTAVFEVSGHIMKDSEKKSADQNREKNEPCKGSAASRCQTQEKHKFGKRNLLIPEAPLPVGSTFKRQEGIVSKGKHLKNTSSSISLKSEVKGMGSLEKDIYSEESPSLPKVTPEVKKKSKQVHPTNDENDVTDGDTSTKTRQKSIDERFEEYVDRFRSNKEPVTDESKGHKHGKPKENTSKLLKTSATASTAEQEDTAIESKVQLWENRVPVEEPLFVKKHIDYHCDDDEINRTNVVRHSTQQLQQQIDFKNKTIKKDTPEESSRKTKRRNGDSISSGNIDNICLVSKKELRSTPINRTHNNPANPRTSEQKKVAPLRITSKETSTVNRIAASKYRNERLSNTENKATTLSNIDSYVQNNTGHNKIDDVVNEKALEETPQSDLKKKCITTKVKSIAQHGSSSSPRKTVTKDLKRVPEHTVEQNTTFDTRQRNVSGSTKKSTSEINKPRETCPQKLNICVNSTAITGTPKVQDKQKHITMCSMTKSTAVTQEPKYNNKLQPTKLYKTDFSSEMKKNVNESANQICNIITSRKELKTKSDDKERKYIKQPSTASYRVTKLHQKASPVGKIPKSEDKIPSKNQNINPNEQRSKPKQVKCITTKSIMIINGSETGKDVILNLQRSHSSREPSPDRLCPLPVTSDEEDGTPRYPDKVLEPEDTVRRNYERISGNSIPETDDIVDITRITDLTEEGSHITEIDKVEETDASLLSVHKKISKFIDTAEQFTKWPQVNKGPAPKVERPKFVVDKGLETDECLLSVSDKVSKFITSAEHLAAAQRPERPKSPRCQNYSSGNEDEHTTGKMNVQSKKLMNLTTVIKPQTYHKQSTVISSEPLECSDQQERDDINQRKPGGNLIDTNIKNDGCNKYSNSSNSSRLSISTSTSTKLPSKNNVPLESHKTRDTNTVKKAKALFENVTKEPGVHKKCNLLNATSVSGSKKGILRTETHPVSHELQCSISRPASSTATLVENNNSLKSTKLVMNRYRSNSPNKIPIPERQSRETTPDTEQPAYMRPLNRIHTHDSFSSVKPLSKLSTSRDCSPETHKGTPGHMKSIERDDSYPHYMKPLEKHIHPDNNPPSGDHLGSKPKFHDYGLENEMPGYMKPICDHIHNHEHTSEIKTPKSPETNLDRSALGYMKPVGKHYHLHGNVPSDKRLERRIYCDSNLADRAPECTESSEECIDLLRDSVPSNVTNYKSLIHYYNPRADRTPGYMKPLDKEVPTQTYKPKFDQQTADGGTPNVGGRSNDHDSSSYTTKSDKFITQAYVSNSQCASPDENVPGYMKPLDRNLRPRSPHRKSMEEIERMSPVNKQNVIESPRSNFGVMLRKTTSGNSTSTPITISTAKSNFDNKEEHKIERSSPGMEIEDIMELETLECMLISVTSYDLRKRIRAQIRLVKKHISENEYAAYRSARDNRNSTSPARGSPKRNSMRPKSIDSRITDAKQSTEGQDKYRKKRISDSICVDKKAIRDSKNAVSQNSFTHEQHDKIAASRASNVIGNCNPDRTPKSRSASELKNDTSKNTVNEFESIKVTQANIKKTLLNKKTVTSEPPSWVKERKLKKITDKSVAPSNLTSVSRRPGYTNKEKPRETSPPKYNKLTDLITSSYGVGPTDENGEPLFGLKALRAQSKTNSMKVQGTVVKRHYYSENGQEPIGEISVTQYSTEPQELGSQEEFATGGDFASVTTTQKFGYKNTPSFNSLPKTQSTVCHVKGNKQTTPGKFTKRDSVKALSQKFIETIVETPKSEKQASYPKAGLILRTSSFKDSAQTNATISSDKREHEESSRSIQTSTRTSESKSFLTNKTKITGVQDILTRMKTEDSCEGDSPDDIEAKGLLNKFIGSQVILTAMEGHVTSKTTETSTCAKAAHTKVTTTLTEGGKCITKTRIFEHPISDEELYVISDEETLKLLLENSTEYEERKKIRARLREVMAEQQACTELLDVNQQQASGKLDENVESSKGTDACTATTTTQVTSRVSSQQQISKKPMSPFAKFRQLDKQNSLNSPSTPKTPSSSGPLFKFTDPAVSHSASTIKDRLLHWCRMKTKEYENIQLDNFSTSWADGLAFCALIHHFLPDAFDYHVLTPKDRRYNFTLAFKVADERADIAPLLDVDDMVATRRPDWKCVFTYVQTIYQRFKDED